VPPRDASARSLTRCYPGLQQPCGASQRRLVCSMYSDFEAPFDRPTELADFLVYLGTYAPEFPEEDGVSTASAFARAFASLDRFAESTADESGREAVLQCKRNLLVAYEYYEHGDDFTGSQMVQETEELFRRARRFIRISDE
jgi:hypothetical protein